MWNFDNTYIKLPKIFFSEQLPSAVPNAKIVVFNAALAKDLGVPFVMQVFAGNTIPKGAMPISQSYAGHQFGHFSVLGDGRAVLLGEQITPLKKRFDIQLKGSGRTAYSRGGDGKAALKPMLREYIISEAMYALGVCTTRSLAVVETGESVYRGAFEKGAVLTRAAASHIRVGTFEYAARFGGVDDLRALADYVIERHFFDGLADDFDMRNLVGADKYLWLFKGVLGRQAALVAKWQLIGFIHGVMNTDNMAISGETIDYGPCAFMDAYDPDTVFSSIDSRGRYSYKNQPKIAAWNLARFADSLLPLFGNSDRAKKLFQAEINGFDSIYQQNWLYGMRAKLGLFNKEEGDIFLANELLQLMYLHKADYTDSFRLLALDELWDKNFGDWRAKWQERIKRQDQSKDEITRLMQSANPAITPKNHLVEEALDAAGAKDFKIMNKLLDALKTPYDYLNAQKLKIKPSNLACGYQTFCGT